MEEALSGPRMSSAEGSRSGLFVSICPGSDNKSRILATVTARCMQTSFDFIDLDGTTRYYRHSLSLDHSRGQAIYDQQLGSSWKCHSQSVLPEESIGRVDIKGRGSMSSRRTNTKSRTPKYKVSTAGFDMTYSLRLYRHHVRLSINKPPQV